MSKENNNKSTTKNNKKLYAILIFIAIILIACISVEAYIYVKTSNRADSVNNLEYVGILEDGTYYISKAPKNIRFQINSTDNNSYTLKDEKENIIETRIISEKGKNLIEAANNYNEGETYYLELVNTNFTEERFKDAKKVKFKIEEPEKANYTLSDKVKFVSSDMEIQNQDGVKTIVLNNNEYSPNDILIKGNENEFNDAYKISEIKDGVAYLTAPEIAEIYEDIDLYKEYQVNFQNVEINEEFKDQIKVGVKKSALYQFLVNESYAADNTDVNITVNKGDNNIKIGITITVPASGRAFLGIPALANHDVNFNFTIDLTSNTITDIQKDSNVGLDVSITEKIDFGISLTSKENVVKGTEGISEEEYEKVIKKLIKQLQCSSMDTTEGDPRITGMKYNMGIPGIDVYFDIYFPVSLSMQVNLAYNQHIEFKQNMGIIMNEKEEVTPYSTIAMTSATSDFNMVGKAELKAGLGVNIGISFISKDFAHIGFSDEVGIYGDAFVTAKITYNNLNQNINTDFVGKVEFGIYNKAQIDAGINIFFLKQDYNQVLEESKNPIIQLGNDQLVKEVAQAIENEAKANAQKQNISNNQNQATSSANNQSTVNSNNSNQNINQNTNSTNESNKNTNLTTNEITEQINFAVNNAIKEVLEYDEDILVKSIEERLDKRYKMVGAYNTLDSDFDHRKYIEPNTQLTYKQRYKSLVSNIDYLFIYDTVSNREFLVRIFRMSSPPLAWCDYSYEIKKEN